MCRNGVAARSKPGDHRIPETWPLRRGVNALARRRFWEEIGESRITNAEERLEFTELRRLKST